MAANPFEYKSPPNWPPPPPGWTPPQGRTPDPAWGPAPEGLQFWVLLPAPQTYLAPSPPPAPRVPARVNRFMRHKVLSGIGAAVVALFVYGAATDGSGKTPAAGNRHDGCGAAVGGCAIVDVVQVNAELGLSRSQEASGFQEVDREVYETRIHWLEQHSPGNITQPQTETKPDDPTASDAPRLH